ncbi:hypothetical protein [Micromonospora sp. NPDC093277]|uniref:hypothetical protein n=1 Tax=Micromonospora sp. NPDC093277 TaxID=3364291 RepID=UPI003801D523
MEPLTAVVLLAGRYGIQQVVAGLTGRPDLGGLAVELFDALSAGQDRLSGQIAAIEQRLSGIEERLDQILDQRYTSAVGAGLRCLVDAGGSTDPGARQDDLLAARGHFRQASGAASSSLQRAAVERYLVLCGLALGRADVARTAWLQLNGAVTMAALEVQAAFDRAPSPPFEMLRHLRASEFRRQLPEWQELVEQRETICSGIVEAASVVEGLLAESGVLGQAVGEPPPLPVRKILWYGEAAPLSERAGRLVADTTAASNLRGVRWVVEHGGVGPVRVGAFAVTWEEFEILPVRPAPFGSAFYPGILWSGRQVPPTHQKPSHVVDVRLKASVGIDPPLPWRIVVAARTPVVARDDRPMSFGGAAGLSTAGAVADPSHGVARPRDEDRPVWSLPAGESGCEITATLTFPADADGVVAGTVEVEVGGFAVLRPVHRGSGEPRPAKR